jgi:uncharacterized RDD family membrane protein YckC
VKCPKCGYLGFDSGDRCRNCGYDFSLVEPGRPDTGRVTPLQVPRRDTDPTLGDPRLARGARYRRTDQPAASAGGRTLIADTEGAPLDLPLFGDDPPSALPPPRAPLSVRRAAATPSRLRMPRETPQATSLPLTSDDAEPLPADTARAAAVTEGGAAAAREPSRAWGDGAPPGRRAAAAAIDLALMIGIDAAVLYFTLRLCGLSALELDVLPPVPLVAFFLVLNGGYVVLFTGALGQTLGKMATDLEVVSDAQDGMDMRRATLRGAAALLSIATAGLGWVLGLIGDRRALHDRLARTRVVTVSAS